jgi:uncharacterized membrane protein (DUF2068 family)
MNFFSVLAAAIYFSLALYAIIFRVKSIRKSMATFKANGDKTIFYSEILLSVITIGIVVFLVHQSRLFKFFSP